MQKQITNARVVLPQGILEGGVCRFTDGIIDYVGNEPAPATATVDAQGGLLLPGFIDIHCHGGNGFDFMDAQPEEMEQIARFHLNHGTTTLLATTMTDSWPNIYAALERMKQLFENGRSLTVRGVHLEGPWLAPGQCGAQPVSGMARPDMKVLEELAARYPFIQRISVAPELPGGLELGRVGRKKGLVMSVAHTDANFDQTVQAADCGYSLMTHLYSGMAMTQRVNAYRVAGAVEAGLYDDRLCVELIADGKHLPAALLKLVYKCKGADGICLITDAMRGAGMPDGSSVMLGSNEHGVPVIVEDGVAKMPDRSGFAGSVAAADSLLRVMHLEAGIDLVSVSRMLSETPARVMGYSDRGSIETGKRADLVLLTDDLNIKKVFLGGEDT